MKVSELIQILQEVPGDTEVFVSSDAEGNRINSVYEAHTALRDVEDTENYPIHEDDIADYPEDYEDVTLVESVFIWP